MEDHNKTLDQEQSIFGYKYTNGFTSANGNTLDVDIVDKDNRYVTTVRNTKVSEKNYVIQDYNRVGIKKGDKIDPKWQKQKSDESTEDYNKRQDDYFQTNTTTGKY